MFVEREERKRRKSKRKLKVLYTIFKKTNETTPLTLSFPEEEKKKKRSKLVHDGQDFI